MRISILRLWPPAGTFRVEAAAAAPRLATIAKLAALSVPVKTAEPSIHTPDTKEVAITSKIAPESNTPWPVYRVHSIRPL